MAVAAARNRLAVVAAAHNRLAAEEQETADTDTVTAAVEDIDIVPDPTVVDIDTAPD